MTENTTATATTTTTTTKATTERKTLLPRNVKLALILGLLLFLSWLHNHDIAATAMGTSKPSSSSSSSSNSTRQKKKSNGSLTVDVTPGAPILEATKDFPPRRPPPILLPMEPPEYYETFPACQIRVYNMVEVHYEVMESIAKQIPFQYLQPSILYNQQQQQQQQQQPKCNPYHLNFEFDAHASGKLRARTWLADMNDRVAGTLQQDQDQFQLNDSRNMTRSFGPAYLGDPNRTSWDTTIQVTCECDAVTRDWLLPLPMHNSNNNFNNNNSTTSSSPSATSSNNICIYHGKCNWTETMPNAIQMSPHYERYFVPSSLPKFDLDDNNSNSNNNKTDRDGRLDICTIGSIWRRNWQLVVPFFQNDTLYQHLYGKIRFRFLGKGGMPYPLRPFQNKTAFASKQIGDDRKFYAAERACGILMLPIARIAGKNYVHYFKSMPNSDWKLSGTIPPIIAFERPFLVPNEILELYRNELPLHVPHRGFDDLDPNGLAEALSSLLDELLLLKPK